MVTPAATAGAQFYKIGDWITFAWNYTSLSATPSHLDILATCSANQATYTLAVNHSASDSTLLWDTGNYQKTATVPLLTETYTLIVYDAESSMSAAPAAGYLGVYNQFTFGMYEKQPYVNWTGECFLAQLHDLPQPTNYFQTSHAQIATPTAPSPPWNPSPSG
jgi:hypothetical protein